MDKPEHKGLENQVLTLIRNKVIDKTNKLKNRFKEEPKFRKAITLTMLFVITSLLLTTYKINEIRTRAYVVYFGEDQIGIVREQEEALNILSDIKRELSSKYNIDIVLNKDINFEDTHAKDELLSSPSEIKNNIRSKISFLVSGYALIVDGEELAYTKKKEDLEYVIETIKNQYLEGIDENSSLEEVSFVENVRIEKRDIPLNKLSDKEELLDHIKNGGEEIKTHIVEVGESLWTIAKIYDVNVDDLIEANSDKDPERLQIGDEIKLFRPKSLLTVKTVERIQYKEYTDYEVMVEYDDKMYKTEKKVKVKGEEGESEYIAKIIKHNGAIVEKEILEEKVIKEPKNELVVQGTKELPKTAATGVFLMPTRGYISSRYGMRSGRMHRGLDIAAKIGTPIKAADGGKVTFVGRKGAYGNLVEIDHENGYVTRYAHCNTIKVKKGDRVYKGQVIATVGNTGRSTGAHLHFEIIKNGKYQNPSSYVK
ncbi:peptidoglycan DD-metalloendopeptidase family protein [Tepidimicrobium xylanilyticum]|uniref:Murein DD-endopeptidase MepM and murein hydrolase activator NlpD, contain LysM domain n=1 Tax=Tepidimicrobium xylanilyticum TaxID=1123352 RepID=A0A1H3AK25_9FIRM|nr:M23 family metallopeptidase [Tepidimicrobium xylanilyticum]GMG98085.1 peptidase M23 [Tepidimicrobium xylanilyticum]SDX30060.1 Murein DD-endopeptidase MepM and murein hydrolase activator NlpD, contain LysM domain [Tepidimicrobium xylanilyticum]